MGAKREIYNAEGYKDTTAFFGMMNHKAQDKKERIPRNIRRGEIYYIMPEEKDLSEGKGRPGIIVSNDSANQFSNSVEVVYLTTKEQTRELKSNVTVRGTGTPSTAICGKVHTVPIERIGSYTGRLTDAEESEINRALLYSLGISEESEPEPEIVENGGAETPNKDPLPDAVKLATANTTANLYKTLYEQLLNEVMTRTYKD